MTFYKRINIIISIILIGIIIICYLFYLNINKRFPSANIVSGDSVEWQELSISSVEGNVYSVAGFNKTYPDIPYFRYLLDRDNVDEYYIFTAKVEIKNNKNVPVAFDLSTNTKLEVKPLLFSNSGPILEKNGLIYPDEIRTQTITVLCGPALADYSRCESIEDNKMELVFSYYPERVSLYFDSIKYVD